MFEGFKLQRADVGEAELRVRYGGTGPAVLLLHGHPRTHVTWHKVASLLAGDSPSYARTCAATGSRPSPPQHPTTALTPSEPWPMIARP